MSAQASDASVPASPSLVIHSAAALLICAVLVAICYLFVDRPVAWFVHNHLAGWTFLHGPTYVPPILTQLAPWTAIAAAAWLAWSGARGANNLFVLSLSPIVAVAVKDQLKWVFGRYWPETWIDNNPSLIQDHAYGFHPFHSGVAYESFPSGHTTIVFSLVSVAWILWPRLRPLWALAGPVIIAALVGSNYHFVGDTVAGAFLGSLTGVYVVRLGARPLGRAWPA